MWGKTVLVTRSREQASRLVELLSAAGARSLEVPTMEIVPPDDLAPLDRALAQLSGYDWVIFTSANGVKAFMDRLFQQGRDVRALGQAKIAAIGPATAEALRAWSLNADLVPETFQAEGLLDALTPQVAPGTRILLARAAVARDVLPENLVRLGAHLDVAPVYQARPPRAVPPDAATALNEGRVDVLTFTSSATVHNFAALVGKARFQELAAHATVAAIGPITAATLKEYGITPQIEPADFTIPALVEAIVDHFTKLQG